MTHTWKIASTGLFFLFTVGMFSTVFADSRSVEGIIYGEDDTKSVQPLPYVSVMVLGTKLGTVTNQDGKFQIQGLSPGRYKLRVSQIGYSSKEIGIDLTHQNLQNVSIYLQRNYLELNQIVVTATRTERIYQETPVPTMVLSNREIQESGASNVANLISDRLGIDLRFGRSGGLSAEVQGTDPKYTLVLIDGEPIVGHFDNRVELSALSTSRIERIEIVKGPGSAMYGSQAMSGVINIITKEATQPLELASEVKIGSNDLRSGTVQFSARTHSWKVFFNGSMYLQGQAPQRDYITLSKVNSYENALKVSRMINNSDDSKLDVNTSFSSHKETSKDVAIRYVTTIQRFDIRPLLKVRYRPWAIYQLKTRIADYQRDYDVYVRKSGYHDLDQSNLTNERVYGGELNYWRQFTDAYEASFGISYQYSQFQANRVSWGKQITSKQWSLFSQSERRLHELWLFSFGARYDWNSNFGNAFAPKLAIMYRPSDQWKFRGSIGKGYRSPSWTELYLTFPHPAVGYTAFGNPNLKQETSIGYHLGFEYLYRNRLLWTVNGFLNEFHNKIEDYAVSPNLLSYKNVGNSYSGGYEVTLKWYLSKNYTFSSGYQWLKVYDRDAQIELPHNRHTANFKIDAKFKNDGVSLSLRSRFWQRFERRYDLFLGNYTNELNRFTPKPMLDATLTVRGKIIQSQHPFFDHFILMGGGTNLLNYTNNIYGPFTGRKWFVSLGWKINQNN